jgi:hypothetical protein
MNDHTLKLCVAEAKRFIAKAKVQDVVLKYDSHTFKWLPTEGRSGKTNAAIKRASMDLTRMLANLRKGI